MDLKEEGGGGGGGGRRRRRRREKTEEPRQTNMMTTIQGKHSHGPLYGTVIENTHNCLLHLTAHMFLYCVIHMLKIKPMIDILLYTVKMGIILFCNTIHIEATENYLTMFSVDTA